jgi:hypothetical protein
MDPTPGKRLDETLAQLATPGRAFARGDFARLSNAAASSPISVLPFGGDPNAPSSPSISPRLVAQMSEAERYNRASPAEREAFQRTLSDPAANRPYDSLETRVALAGLQATWWAARTFSPLGDLLRAADVASQATDAVFSDDPVLELGKLGGREGGAFLGSLTLAKLGTTAGAAAGTAVAGPGGTATGAAIGHGIFEAIGSELGSRAGERVVELGIE